MTAFVLNPVQQRFVPVAAELFAQHLLRVAADIYDLGCEISGSMASAGSWKIARDLADELEDVEDWLEILEARAGLVVGDHEYNDMQRSIKYMQECMIDHEEDLVYCDVCGIHYDAEEPCKFH